MTDEKRFRIIIYLTIIFVLLSIIYNISSEYIDNIAGYIERRAYYEKVISKKGLSLHKALYWRKED